MHESPRIHPTRMGRVICLIGTLLLCGCEWPSGKIATASMSNVGTQKITRVAVVVVGIDAMNRRMLTLSPALNQEFQRYGHEVRIVPLACESREAECVAQKVRDARDDGVKIFITLSTQTSQSVRAIDGIQVVFTSRADPVSYGLVESHIRPGGNFTGVFLEDTLHLRRMQLLRHTLRTGSRVGVIADGDWIAHAKKFDLIDSTARGLGLSLKYWKVENLRDIAELEPQLGTVDGFYIPLTLSTAIHGDQVVKLVNRARKPGVFPSRLLFDQGAAMAYYFDEGGVDLQLATLARKIALGEKASTLPVESPKIIELAIDVASLAKILPVVPAELLFAANVTR